MARKAQTVKGMQDLLPEDLAKIDYVEELFLKKAEQYGFLRVQTPTLEPAELYRSTSEFSEERCYSLVDGKGRKMILRSDPDAPLVRLVANHFLYAPKPVKLAFSGSIFRSWNNRRREFRMFSINTFGVDEPSVDAEILRVIADIVEEVGFPGYRIEFNNLKFLHCIIDDAGAGLQSCDEIGDILYAIRFAPDTDSVIASLVSHNLPRKVIDAILELLECRDDESRAYNTLDRLRNVFPSLTPEIEKTSVFQVELKRCGITHSCLNVSNLHGTGFYSGLTYRLFPEAGKKEAGDGGRYDHMMQRLYGESMPATGIGLGIERFIGLMEANHCSLRLPPKAKGIVVAFAESSLAIRCRPVLRRIRSAGQIVEEDLVVRGFDKTIRYAKSKGYGRAIIVSPSESDKFFHLKIVNLDDDRTDSVVARDLEDLYDTLLRC